MDPGLQAAVATAQRQIDFSPGREPIADEERSSSLSELEDGEDEASAQLLPPSSAIGGAGDSEAETERIDSSPNKLFGRSILGHSPSRLSENIAAGGSPDVERFSDSVISSPISLVDEPLSDPDDEQEPSAAVHVSAKKRKRSMFDDEELLKDDISHTRRKRTHSVASDDKSLSSSDVDEDETNDGNTPDITNGSYTTKNDDQTREPKTNGERDSHVKVSSPRSISRGKSSPVETGEAPRADPGGDDEEAEEEDVGLAEEAIDDVEAIAKSEEEGE